MYALTLNRKKGWKSSGPMPWCLSVQLRTLTKEELKYRYERVSQSLDYSLVEWGKWARERQRELNKRQFYPKWCDRTDQNVQELSKKWHFNEPTSQNLASKRIQWMLPSNPLMLHNILYDRRHGCPFPFAQCLAQWEWRTPKENKEKFSLLGHSTSAPLPHSPHSHNTCAISL